MKIFGPLLFRQTYTMWLRGRQVKHPGIQKRLDLMSQDTPDLSKLKINERDIEDFEADLADVETLAEHHQSEINKIRKTIQFQQIERKYFGVNKKPNMLTWSEKEQIRHLNHMDPEIWTPEKLADSFPATIDVIKKLIRSQWIPRDLKRVKKHDKAVSANWKAFETGRLNLPENLKEHFGKFTSRRKIANNDTPRFDLTETIKKEEGEWSRIVSKSQNNTTKNSTKKIEKDTIPHPPMGSDTYVIGGEKRSKKLVTLSQLKNIQVQEPETDGKDPFDKAFIMHCIESRLIAKERHTAVLNSNPLPRYKTSQTSAGALTNDQMKEEKIQMTIKIPKTKWKKGAIYRVNDCYYSDEGKFLYKAVFGRKT